MKGKKNFVCMTANDVSTVGKMAIMQKMCQVIITMLFAQFTLQFTTTIDSTKEPKFCRLIGNWAC